MQTAIKKLIEELLYHLAYDDDLTEESRHTLEKVVDKCKGKLEMEKQQIINAYDNGFSSGYDDAQGDGAIFEEGKDYYAETYGSKGSDAHIVDTNEMIDQVPDVRKMVEDDNYLTPVDWLMDRIKWMHRETYDYLIKEGQYDRAKRMESSTSSQKEFMTIERIKEIQSKTAYPDSTSVQQALLQVWNECTTSSQTEISDDRTKLHWKTSLVIHTPEISDEEIEEKSLQFDFDETFRIGAKWYREQLKLE